MTGIERLRELGNDYVEHSWSEAGKRRGMLMLDIADQIEREHVSRTRVLTVVTEMERHVSGVEGMEDSPVARWARELREALGGDGRDPAADVSVSAYDLLPQEDREAISWVRDHGGLERVRAQRRESMPRAAYERKKAGFLGHIAECETALGRRNERIKELGCRVNDLMIENTELRRRAMPEGYEWPRYESGEPLRYEDRYVYDGRECEVWHVDFDSYGEPTILNKDGTRFHPDKGERVKRPAPAVLAADGEPLEVGQTVWHVGNGIEFTVIGLPRSGEYQSVKLRLDDGAVTGFDPDQLTHERPVLDADGVPIKAGDTVWPKYPYEEPDRQVESAEVVYVHRLGRIDIQAKYATGMSFRQQVDAEQLTHAKPEPIDTWQRIEEDATLSPEVYCHRNGIDISQKDGTEIFLADTVEPMARDLVRRCRALAERERGE